MLASKFKSLNILLILFLAVVGVFIVNNNIFNDQGGFTFYEFTTLFVVYIVTLFSVIFVGRKYFKHLYPLLIMLGAVFILDIVMTILIQSPIDTEVLGLHGEYWMVHFEIDTFFRYESIARFFVVLSLAYTAFVLLPQLFTNEGKVVSLLLLVISICLVLVLVSLVSEFNNYITFIKCLFSGDQEGMFLASPKSVFPNKNGFAFILFLLIIASLLLHHYKRHWMSYLFIVIGFIVVLFTICKTVIILSLVITSAYLIYRLVDVYKVDKKKGYIITGIAGGLILVLLAVVLIVPILRNNIFEMFFNIGGRTIEVREYIWSNAYLILGIGGIFTGKGYGTFDALITVYNYSDPGGGEGYAINAHNGYLEMIGTAGVFYLLIAILFEVYFLYKVIKHLKDERELSLFTLLFFVLIHIYMIFEAMTPVFSYSLDHLCMNALLFIPILSLDYKEEVERDIAKVEKKNLSLTLLSLISIAVLPALAASKQLWVTSNASVAFIVVMALLAAIVIAISTYLVIKDKRNLGGVIETFGFIIFFAVSFALISNHECTFLTILIAPIVSLTITLVLNSFIKKLPLNICYDEIYNYLDYKLDSSFSELSKKDNSPKSIR